ncbi:AfsR/SARP family transcriptional regulator [Streptomyces paludis]|uniref:OmpR/PhoB-type domain-containing protein n=1 Tax=Streptomyces paludis TaxID=2282738 RepID=A0A345HY69_9ACTN|nr:AfsR/SARP family transcriptional regulator [Streptomyces paludis]AXG81643.1 hypothetical protein DVK44_32410 [Streptomyces paludis]
MQFRILGPPELYDETRDRSLPIGAPRPRRLLGTLLTRPDSPVAGETLVRELWGVTPPRGALHSLGVQVAALRRALRRLEPGTTPGSSRLVARGAGYALRVRPAETDFGVFGQTLARARRTAALDPEGTYASLRRGLALWRGPVLGGGALGPRCAGLAAGLERERRLALEIYFDCALRTGRHERVVPELRDAVAADPLRERLHDQLMLALCRCGRGPEAIGVYRRARARLVDAAGGTPLLTARLEQISVCSPVLADPAAEPGPAAASLPGPVPGETVADPPPLSVTGYLAELLSGRVLSS